MSSLAGALDDYPQAHLSTHGHFSDDIEMTTPLSTKNKYGEEEEEEEDDDDDEAKADAEMSDLFGNDNDVLEERHTRHSSPTASGPESERLLSPERERRQALEYGEDDAPPEIAVEVKEAEVRFPNLPVPKASDGDNWVIRMPNYVKVDTKPFHPDTYIGPEHEDEELAQGDSVREKSMSIKLKVENTLRWRWAKDANGQDKKESNSRIIRWSDGTLSLRLGKELFDINQSIDTSASVVRQTIGGTPSQSQSQPPATPSAPTPGKSEGLTYLVAQHKRSQVLQSEAVITGYMSLRPTGMQSETHMMLVRAVEQKHKQVARLKMAPNPSIDPEREKMEMIKQSAKKSKKKADDGERLGSRRRRNYRRSAEGPTWSDDDEVDHADMYGASDEDDDDMGINRSPRKQKRKASGEKGEEDYQADDFVVPDESEDDGDGAGRSRKRARDGDEPEDELERMEANLEKQAAAEKRSKKKGGDDDEEDSDEDGAGAMDVESEEEEEEFKVRRVTSKRAIALDDEDE